MSSHSFVSKFVEMSARRQAQDLASRVQVHRPETDDSFEVTCGKRMAKAENHPDPAELCRNLDNAVAIVLGMEAVT